MTKIREMTQFKCRSHIHANNKGRERERVCVCVWGGGGGGVPDVNYSVLDFIIEDS